MNRRTKPKEIIAIALISSLSILATAAKADTKHVFELFTSQGCYSCPPADELLGQIIAENDDILGLEFHVDYWDSLVYGSAGMWKDPFSSAEYSKRQRDYNRQPLAGRTGVYTPQMVVNGDYAFVGSSKRIARKQMKRKTGWVLETSVEVSKDGNGSIQVDGNHRSDADIWLITFDEKHSTNVTAGENMGEVINNFNVVRAMESVGKWEGQPVQIDFALDALDDNQNCAVIVQQYDSLRKTIKGPILGASECRKI